MRWSLFKEQNKWVIRRWKDGKYQRLPIAKYKRIRESEAELEELVKRLNAPVDAKAKVDFKHAFISVPLLETYQEFLANQIPSPEGARQEFSYLRRYFLNYFIGKLDLMNPLDWHKVHETKWASYLLGKDCPAAAKTKRDIVIAANRFMKWLHKQRPEEVPPLEFTPITKAKYKELEARRELDGKVKERGFIPDHDWQKIRKKLPKDIEPFVLLSYHYGLRRSEVLGLEPGDVKKGHLTVQRQLSAIHPKPLFKPLKGRSARRVLHWNARAAEAYTWIVEGQRRLSHPSTLTHRWAELMKSLDMSYDFHDLRHTFITKALRDHKARDVQLAAGHRDIRTTMGYAHDDRDLSDEAFIPEAS